MIDSLRTRTIELELKWFSERKPNNNWNECCRTKQELYVHSAKQPNSTSNWVQLSCLGLYRAFVSKTVWI